MESLSCPVGREGNQFGSWMPSRVDTRRNGIVAFQINFFHLAVVHNHSGRIRETHMEEHVVGLVVLIAVTVDALAYPVVVHGNLIVEDLCLFESGDVTLGNLHRGPCDV